MANNQVTVANLNGQKFEDLLVAEFVNKGFSVFTETEVSKEPQLLNGITRYVLRNAKFMTIYGQDGRTEFVAFDLKQKRAIRIEAKWQAVAGSVDEKYPYMLLNSIYQYPEKEIIFAVDGGGYKPGARQWLQDHIDNNWLNYRSMGKSIKLINYQQFVAWVQAEF